jgi:hypothetical protein
MAIDLFSAKQLISVDDHVRRARNSWRLMFFLLFGLSGLTFSLMLRYTPSLSMIAWIFYWVGMLAIFYNPRYGVYLIIFLTLIGDTLLLYWYPFVKNFSSAESIMYAGRAVNFSPLETYLVVVLVSWFGRMFMERRFRFYTGPLFWPAISFIFFITVALVYGILRRGVLNIALWEVRGIYYLPIMLIIVSNLIETRDQVNKLVWCIALSLSLKGIAGIFYIATQLNWDIGSVESIAQHPMSIQFNAFFFLVILAWFYHDSALKRLVFTFFTPIVFFSFFANHRRAGFLTLIIGIGIIGAMLYRENRKLFFTVVPVGLFIFLVYLAIFWNSTGSAALVATSVRSVIGQPTERDKASNVYRDLEDLNTIFNIRKSPLTGLGFGNKFIIVAPMPDISFFEWWEYITHNSIMWIWMDAGIGAFLSMLMLTGMTMIVGGRAVWTSPKGPMRGVVLAATLYVLTHFIFAYADMSWEGISLTFVGAMMGLVNSFDLIIARPLPAQVKRWPWVPDIDLPPSKRWPWIPDQGVLPAYQLPKQMVPVTLLQRASQANRAAAHVVKM